jgi:mannose-6-phosphate isomerase
VAGRRARRAVRREGVELLVKLIDAGQRLPVHLHPARAFSRRHLGITHGKTEAWVVVDADPGAVVGLGLRRPLTSSRSAVSWPRTTARRSSTRSRREVSPGDGVLVPAGTPHFIGAGVLVVEVQEPTDLSILLEWDDFDVDGDRDGHLDLGYDVALQALDLAVWTPGRPRRARPPGRPAVGAALRTALPAEADPYFRADFVEAGPVDGAVPPGSRRPRRAPRRGPAADLRVRRPAGDPRGRRPGAVVRGGWELDGEVGGVLCRPPAPDAPAAPR